MTAHASATNRLAGSATFTDDTPLMVWQAALDGSCIFCNPAWLRFTGRSLAQELGNGWLEGLHDEDRGVCVSEFRQAVGARRGFRLRLRVRRADGVYRLLAATGAPRFAVEGALQGSTEPASTSPSS